MGVYEIDPLRDPRWPEFLQRKPCASVFHTRGWLEALKRTYGYEPVAYTTSSPTTSDLANGWVFCRVRSCLTGNRLVSLPFSDHCDPLVEQPEHYEELLGMLRHEREERRWKYIECRPANLINQHAKAYDARGFRGAVLYRNPDWLAALDFSFDMSIPNVAHLDPQRGGCCTIMPYFIGNILELPVTTTQDYMLFHLLDERSIDLWKTQIDLITERNGLVSFIVHPDYALAHEVKAIYKNLLSYLREAQTAQAIWVTLPSEVDRWWRARSNMQLVSRNNEWHIEGEGAERALVAFAKNVGGKLVYELESDFAGASRISYEPEGREHQS
jgi:hypothetical protein